MGVTIRRFTWADVPHLLPLFSDTIRRVNSRDYTPEQVEAWSAGKSDSKRWTELFADRYTVIAELEDKIVGFGELEIGGHIDRFFVHADHQGEGIGRAMMGEILAEATRLGIVRLDVEASITARPFFERFGFSVLAEQAFEINGVPFTNFKMERMLPAY